MVLALIGQKVEDFFDFHGGIGTAAQVDENVMFLSAPLRSARRVPEITMWSWCDAHAKHDIWSASRAEACCSRHYCCYNRNLHTRQYFRSWLVLFRFSCHVTRGVVRCRSDQAAWLTGPFEEVDRVYAPNEGIWNEVYVSL